MANQYGICQWCLPVAGTQACFEAAKLGLDGIELDDTDDLRQHAAAYARSGAEAGITFPTLGMNVFCQRSYTKPEGKAFFAERVKSALDMAAQLGVRTLQFPAFFASAITNEDELKCAAECFSEACRLAKAYNLTVGTENALTLEENLRLFSLVDSDRFAFYFDTQNLLQMRSLCADEVLLGMADKLCEVHAKDCLLKPSGACAGLGLGETDFVRTAGLIKQTGYQGWVHLENQYDQTLAGLQGEEWQECIRRDLQTVRQLLD